MGKRPHIRKPHRYLIVDSENYAQCLHELNRLWKAKHPGCPINSGGRPSLKSEVFKECELQWAKLSEKFSRRDSAPRPTMNQLMKAVGEKLGFAKGTIHKYVKQWMLETRSVNDMTAQWLRNQRWVQDLAIVDDYYGGDLSQLRTLLTNRQAVHCTFTSPDGSPPLSLVLSPFPKDPRQFIEDAQTFLADPARLLAFIVSLRPSPRKPRRASTSKKPLPKT